MQSTVYCIKLEGTSSSARNRSPLYMLPPVPNLGLECRFTSQHYCYSLLSRFMFFFDDVCKRLKTWFCRVACMEYKRVTRYDLGDCIRLLMSWNAALSLVVISAPACRIRANAHGISSLLQLETASATTWTS